MIRVKIPEWGVTLTELEDIRPLYLVVAAGYDHSGDLNFLLALGMNTNAEEAVERATETIDSDIDVIHIKAYKLSSLLSQAAMMDKINTLNIGGDLD